MQLNQVLHEIRQVEAFEILWLLYVLRNLKTFGDSTVCSKSAFHGVLCISEQRILISVDSTD
jgi:hypothetical protein